MKLKMVQKISWGILGAMMAAFALMWLTKNDVFGFVLIGLLVVYVAFMLTFWRCPHCHKFLGELRAFKYCRRCGAEVDTKTQ